MSTPIKNWRMTAGRAAEDVANEAGVTLAMWSRWETGARQVPPHRVLLIEQITGISRHVLRPDVFGALQTDQPDPYQTVNGEAA